MTIGGVIGILGIPVPHVEIMIALSMLGLGLTIASAWKPHEVLAIVVISVFAIFHGYAHGAELPKPPNRFRMHAAFAAPRASFISLA